jgi:hypothetical protein
MNMIFSRAAWLYLRTPIVIVEYIKTVINNDYTRREWCWGADAAGRCFRELSEYRALYQAVARRIKRSRGVEPFPIQSARGVWRILMLREDGEKGLDCELARLLAKATLTRLRTEQNENRFSILYFQLIRFLLYLLRYRKTDPSCFDPNDWRSMDVFEQTMDSMKKARKYFNRRRNFSKATRIKRIADGFEQYLHYKGSEDILTLLSEEAGGID